MARRKPLPDPVAIASRCAVVQATWSDRVRLSRKLGGDAALLRRDVAYTIPECRAPAPDDTEHSWWASL